VEQEGRQIFLRDTKAGRKVGGALRADYERLRDKFQEDMANAVVRETDKEGNVTVTPNEEMRKAITARFREQIQALIEKNERVGVGVISLRRRHSGVGLKAPGDDVNRTLEGRHPRRAAEDHQEHHQPGRTDHVSHARYRCRGFARWVADGDVGIVRHRQPRPHTRLLFQRLARPGHRQIPVGLELPRRDAARATAGP
jgi:hypothetical protein